MLSEQVYKGGGGVVCSVLGKAFVTQLLLETHPDQQLWLGLALAQVHSRHAVSCNSVSFFLIMCTVINTDCSFDRIKDCQETNLWSVFEGVSKLGNRSGKSHSDHGQPILWDVFLD